MRGMSLAHTSSVDGDLERERTSNLKVLLHSRTLHGKRKKMVRVLMEVDVEVAELIIFSTFIELGGNET